MKLPGFVLLVSCLCLAIAACTSTPAPISEPPQPAPPQTRPAPATTQPIAATLPPTSFDPAVTLPYLASDALEGRGVGTTGLDLAGDFLADHFRAAGLKPLPGLTDYFQPFDYTAASKPADDCSLTIARHPLKLNDDYRPLGNSAQSAFDGLVIFAGYGITSKAHNYDDYAGLDARGKVVLAMRFEPMDAKGKSLFAAAGTDWSDDASLKSKIANAAAHGATALLLFTPAGLEQADPLIPFPHDARESNPSLPAIHIKRSAAELILGTNTPLTYSQDGKPAAATDQVVSASGRVRVERTVAHLRNVVGYIPGAGPLANEYVIVGAHYDHLGRGRLGAIFGPAGAIYHGADDNASGTATVLELASRAAATPGRKRSVIFALFSAEEEGLIGSTYFANHPPIDLNSVVAMLNMDMVGRIRNDTLYVGGNGTATDFDDLITKAQQHQPLMVKPMPVSVGGRGGLGPSDHMAFALKHIPVLFLFSGMHADYHRPTDTPDKINYAGIGEVADFAGHLLDEMAAMPREPYQTSADIGSMGLTSGSAGDHLSGASLGVIPDYTTDATEAGVLIQGVRPGSGADTAGLQGGDLIVQFNDKPLTGLQDLADCLAMARAGDKVALKVHRGKQTLLLHAALTQRQG